jgi:hypothetical protein
MAAAGFDVIGDVHGHAARLVSLLQLMGYEQRDGAWRHPGGRTAIFLGDLIDRGPSQLETLRIVRAMVDAGSARVLLGNHEFNAVAYATPDPVRGDYCRPHTEKNRRQHEAFLAEVPFGSPLHQSVIEWFRTFPLWLDLGGLRVVHACWSDRHRGHLAPLLGAGDILTDEAVIDGTTEGTDTYDAIETILKGPEIDLHGVSYRDKDGNPRHRARRRWWDGSATTVRDAALVPAGTELFGADGSPVDELCECELDVDALVPDADDGPVLFGHYWWRKKDAEEFGEAARCIDYSVARGGVLAAYRWSGEARLDPANLVDC